MAIRILVVDDDLKLVEMLRRALTFAGYQVNEAFDGQTALETAAVFNPDLVILDWMLPGMNGIEVCRRMQAAGDMRILMLTAKDTVDDKVSGLQAGADDYLTKPFAIKELLARVEVLLRRQLRADAVERPEKINYADLILDTGSREVWRGNRPITLTSTEYELLLLFLRHPQQVLSRSLIMERVWGYDFSNGSNVLDVYIGYLRRKLEEGGESRMIFTVRGAGYILRTTGSGRTTTNSRAKGREPNDSESRGDLL